MYEKKPKPKNVVNQNTKKNPKIMWLFITSIILDINEQLKDIFSPVEDALFH